MSVIDLFDFHAGKARKREGMDDAAHGQNRTPLCIARRIARDLAKNHPLRECHADAVSKELLRQGYPPSLGPAAGSLFKGREWKFTGERICSARASNHAREIKVWRLV